jgi:hypothetical protein
MDYHHPIVMHVWFRNKRIWNDLKWGIVSNRIANEIDTSSYTYLHHNENSLYLECRSEAGNTDTVWFVHNASNFFLSRYNYYYINKYIKSECIWYVTHKEDGMICCHVSGIVINIVVR